MLQKSFFESTSNWRTTILKRFTDLKKLRVEMPMPDIGRKQLSLRSMSTRDSFG